MERELSDSEDEEESDDNEGSKAQVNLKEGKVLLKRKCSTGINWKIVSTYEPRIVLTNPPA
eukprot:4340699-Pyramimonas_sp.AAC.1